MLKLRRTLNLARRGRQRCLFELRKSAVSTKAVILPGIANTAFHILEAGVEHPRAPLKSITWPRRHSSESLLRRILRSQRHAAPPRSGKVFDGSKLRRRATNRFYAFSLVVLIPPSFELVQRPCPRRVAVGDGAAAAVLFLTRSPTSCGFPSYAMEQATEPSALGPLSVVTSRPLSPSHSFSRGG